MIPVIKTDLILAPVTALLFHGPYLLSGEGPQLHVYDTITQRRIASQNVLATHRIHGIRQGQERIFVVFGQKAFRVLLITSDSGMKSSCSFAFQNQICELSDWIWDVQWLKENNHLALALGHNSIALWDCMLGVLLQEIHCNEKCILYSASFFNTSWSDLVLAAGTVFNQVVIWRPTGTVDKEGRVVPDLRCIGHEGVIFNMQYSFTHEMLCSVSDDRSIRVWKIELSEHRQECAIADADLVMYGHSARVWSVRLLSNYIVSIGEDATCIVWNYDGEVLHKFKGHRGRSIWSVAVNEDESLIATGGGDSSIRLWSLRDASENDATIECLDLKDYIETAGGSRVEDFPRTVMLTNMGEVIIMTNAGYLLGYHLLDKSWHVITHDERFQSYVFTALSPSHHLVALGNIHGDVKIVDLYVPDNTQYLNVFQSKVLGLCWTSDDHLFLSGPEGKLFLCKIVRTPNEITVEKLMSFVLPPSKQRWITAAVQLPHGQGYLCGDKRGSIHHFVFNRESLNAPVSPVTTLRGVHGKVGVTHICCHKDSIYSTGRDGTYKQYSICNGTIQLMNTNKVYKGFEWIEQLIFRDDGEIQVLGFHTVHFVVWSVTNNQTVFQVKCGGGHRTWGFAEPNQRACLAYVKARDVMVCHTPCTLLNKQNILKSSLHGREVTCAKFLDRVSLQDSSYLLVATASEDTTVNILAINYDEKEMSDVTVVKTLQDHVSSVRDLAICKAYPAKITEISMDNQSSQNPAQKSKLQTSALLLFSVGGRCTIKCWQILWQDTVDDLSSACTVSLLASYSTLDTSQRHKRLKRGQLLDPDTRYMALTVLPARNVDESLPHYVTFLTIGASDGFLRLFSFNQMEKMFTIIWSTGWHNVCLLSVKHFIHNFPAGNAAIVCSAGTDGRVALWDITNKVHDYCRTITNGNQDKGDKLSVKEDSRNMTELPPSLDIANLHDSKDVDENSGRTGSERLMEDKKKTMATNLKPARSLSPEHSKGHLVEGGPNSKDNLELVENEMSATDFIYSESNCLEKNSGKPLLLMTMHQSGINALDVIKKDSCYLLATGGDDNAIHVTMLSVKGQEYQHMLWEVQSSFCVTSAHATLVSGLRFVDDHTLLSSSIDQRLNTWRISPNNSMMTLIGSTFLHVADVSGLDTVELLDKTHIIIPGQGLQLLSITDITQSE